MPPNKKTIAVVQSSYIPWKGYFDLIRASDEFVLLDDVQYTKRDWRNRNRIQGPHGPQWLTIPVHVKGRFRQQIKDVTICDSGWNVKHWKSICRAYSKTAYFGEYRDQFEDLYLGFNAKYLSEINHHFLSEISRMLGIQTKISWAMDYPCCPMEPGKTERLIHMCKQTNAECYLSGPKAKIYIREDLFRKEGIRLRYYDYANYPEHRQLYPPFHHHFSIIDLIFNEGPRAALFMKEPQLPSAMDSRIHRIGERVKPMP